MWHLEVQHGGSANQEAVLHLSERSLTVTIGQYSLEMNMRTSTVPKRIIRQLHTQCHSRRRQQGRQRDLHPHSLPRRPTGWRVP